MIIREYKPSDLGALIEMWEKQGVSYEWPDVGNPRFVSKLIMENGENRPIMAAMARLTAEGYFLLDKEVGTPESRLNGFHELHKAIELDLLSKGLEDFHCWVSPEVKGFGKRLKAIGWVPDGDWTPYCFRLKGAING